MDNNYLIQPVSQRVYGSFVYWLSIIASLICAIAPVLAVAFPSRNIINPHYLFTAIWEGMTPSEIWQTAGNGFPGGHFWVNNLTLGDGLAEFGLVIGCYCAGVALCATAITHMTLQPRSFGWALVSIIIAAMITLAATGVYQQA
ncbi:MAG TPA: hypothetical protein G4O07_00965 [Dehalococcoidia bacterium]|nr:hypothetical protein [Dehalococcoidia bacterium]